MAALAIVVIDPAFAQTEFNSSCLCQYGNDATTFSAEISLTDANRGNWRKAMESGDYALGKIVRATSKGCEPAEWRKPYQCKPVKVTTFNGDGSPNVKEYDNIVVTGSKVLRVTAVGGLPVKARLGNGQVTLDDEKWAKLPALLVIGKER